MLILLWLVLWYLWGLATVMRTVLYDCLYYREAWGLSEYSLAFWLKYSSTVSSRLSGIHPHALLFVLKPRAACASVIYTQTLGHGCMSPVAKCSLAAFSHLTPVSFSRRLVCLSRAGLEQCGRQATCALPHFNLSFPHFLASWREV